MSKRQPTGRAGHWYGNTNARIHGYTKHPLYKVWGSMIQRCNDPKRKSYSRYGGRGIGVCERWRHSFENFMLDMGPRPHGFTIERIDNEKGYEPTNCKWATMRENIANRSTFKSIRLVTFNGEIHYAKEWARKLGQPYGRILYRLNTGLPAAEVFSPTRRNKWSSNLVRPARQ